MSETSARASRLARRLGSLVRNGLIGRRPGSAAGAAGAGVEGMFSRTAAAGGTVAEGTVAEGAAATAAAAPALGVCAVAATGAAGEADADDAEGYPGCDTACDTGCLEDAGALGAAGATADGMAADGAASEDAGDEAGEDACAADALDACDAGGGTVMTAEQTEHRARTPAAGTLCGSSSNSVKQDRHCTTMAFIAV